MSPVNRIRWRPVSQRNVVASWGVPGRRDDLEVVVEHVAARERRADVHRLLDVGAAGLVREDGQAQAGGRERRLVPVVEVLAGHAAQVHRLRLRGAVEHQVAGGAAQHERADAALRRERQRVRRRGLQAGDRGRLLCRRALVGDPEHADRGLEVGGAADRDGQPARIGHRAVDAGAAGLDQLVAHAARQRQVGERAALSEVVQVAELAPAHVERGAAEARLDAGLDARPGPDFLDDRLDGGGCVEGGVDSHATHDASSSAVEVKPPAGRPPSSAARARARRRGRRGWRAGSGRATGSRSRCTR